MRIGKRVYVGLSPRTNRAGIEQMRGILEPLGYTVHAIDVTGCGTPARGFEKGDLLLYLRRR